ncbi:MFS transporter [Micromonospora sp. NPDC049282]|uniref:MFS transporter n=1 Tax=Micromonospora sp. NPDC049282 TaxID=3364269 RepID=UPI00371274CE
MNEDVPHDTGALRSVAGLAGAIVSAAIPPFLVGALAPRIALSIPLDTGDVGIAMAGFYLVSGVLSPAGGRVVHRMGPTAALRWACGLSTLGLAAISAASNPVQMIVLLTLLGVPNAVVQPSCNEVLSRLRSSQVRAVSFGAVQSSIPVATLIAGVLLAVASYGIGWRWTVLGVAVLTVAAQLPIPNLAPNTGAVSAVQPAPRRRSTSAARGPARGLLGLLVATGFLASCAVTSLPSFAATTGHHFGLAPWVIAAAQMLGSVGSAVMRVVAPALTSRASARRQLVAVALLQGTGTLGFVALASGSSAGFVAGTIAAFTFGWGFNGLFNLIVTDAHPGRIATATGLTQGGVFIGGMAGPLVFAAIAGSDRFGAAWLAMALFMCGALSATLLAARRARSVTTAHTVVPAGPVTVPEGNRW